MTASSGPDTWHAAWEATLAELELTVAQAEAMLHADHDFADAQTETSDWRPPAGIGQIPAPLVQRARTLLARQVDVAQRLARAAQDSRRQGRAVSQITVTQPAPPVYIDVPA